MGTRLTRGNMLRIIICGICLFVAYWLFTKVFEEVKKQETAEAQVTEWVEKLHSQTTGAGMYKRHEGEELPVIDPWGNPLNVLYIQGGVMETVTVRSAGPDKKYHTRDDIVAKRMVTNFKGIGTGVKENIEEFAEKGARGATRGVIQGLKEGWRGTDGK